MNPTLQGQSDGTKSVVEGNKVLEYESDKQTKHRFKQTKQTKNLP
jgi:hypothetical protein